MDLEDDQEIPIAHASYLPLSKAVNRILPDQAVRETKSSRGGLSLFV